MKGENYDTIQKTCDKCRTVKTVKLLKTTKEFFDILEELKKLSASDGYEYVGGNNPADTIMHWTQDGLWYRIKCKSCGATLTLWYDAYHGNGSFVRKRKKCP